MKTKYALAASLLAGAAIGAAAVQTLHAQAKPPAYVITDADVSNGEAYTKDYLPLVRKAFLEGGAKYLASNGKTVTFAGEPPKHVAILAFENLDNVCFAPLPTESLHLRERTRRAISRHEPACHSTAFNKLFDTRDTKNRGSSVMRSEVLPPLKTRDDCVRRNRRSRRY
jgi:uncharacterized protein (DUF1330 family)